MKQVRKTVLLSYSAREMYELVTAVEAYPAFLPWCASAELLERHDDGVTARPGVPNQLIAQPSHLGMDNPVEGLPFALIGEDDVTQRCPVERAVREQHVRPPSCADRLQGGRAGTNRLAGQLIGVDNSCAEVGQDARDLRLATGYVACEG